MLLFLGFLVAKLLNNKLFLSARQSVIPQRYWGNVILAAIHDRRQVFARPMSIQYAINFVHRRFVSKK